MAAITAMQKFVGVNISLIAQAKPLLIPAPDRSNSAINKLE